MIVPLVALDGDVFALVKAGEGRAVAFGTAEEPQAIYVHRTEEMHAFVFDFWEILVLFRMAVVCALMLTFRSKRDAWASPKAHPGRS